MANGAFGFPLPPEQIAALRRIVRARGVVGAARFLGLSRGTIERALAGIGVRPGTIALVRLALSVTAQSTPTVPQS
jgi:DNA-binding phage protein